MGREMQELNGIPEESIENVFDYGSILRGFASDPMHLQVWYRKPNGNIDCIDFREPNEVRAARMHPKLADLIDAPVNMTGLEESSEGLEAAMETNVAYGAPIPVDGCLVRYNTALEKDLPAGHDFRALFGTAAKGQYNPGEEQSFIVDSGDYIVSFSTDAGEIIAIEVEPLRKQAES